MRFKFPIPSAEATNPGGADSLPPLPPLPTSCPVALHFAPRVTPSTPVVAAIAAARSSIRLQAYSFTHPLITSALIAAHHRGVDVAIVAEIRRRNHRTETLVNCHAAGIPVWLDGVHVIHHDKNLVIDGELIFSGSFNWSYNADRAAETLIVLGPSPELAAHFLANWNYHRSHSLPWVVAAQPVA